jgi:hypothetical protein
LIDGYYLPRPHETALDKESDAFARAKGECVDALRATISAIESLTAEDFSAARRRNFC